MVHHYKLTYFNGKGLAETARILFALAGQDYEDVRVEFSDWPALQSTTPFGKLPLLEEDGKILAQSNTIARYLARKFGFSGKNAWEEAQCDSLVDQIVDFRTESQKFFSAAFGFLPDEDLGKLKTDVLEPSVKKHLPFFVKALKNSGGHGFLVGEAITWADIALSNFTAALAEKAPETLDDFPEIKAHSEKILSIPAIKAWVEKRPTTVF